MSGSSTCLWRWLWIASFGCCAAIVAPQNQPRQQSPVFRAERHEVEVVVSVRDSMGQPVSNLKVDDFEIRDNGKPQNITSFAVQGATEFETAASTPRTPSAAVAPPSATVERRFIALFFDDVRTEPGDFARIQKAAEQFVREGMQGEDRVAIFKASQSGEVTFTNDKGELFSTIDALRATRGQSIAQCPRNTIYEAYLIVNQLDPDALTMVAGRMKNCMCPPPNSLGCPTMEDFKRMSESLAGGRGSPKA